MEMLPEEQHEQVRLNEQLKLEQEICAFDNFSPQEKRDIFVDLDIFITKKVFAK